MRHLLSIVLLSLISFAAGAQSADAPSPSMVRSGDWHVTLTLFRSPGTGLQVSKGHFAAFVGHYPTVIERDGERRTTHFLRMGASYYANPAGSNSPYASVSIAPSLTEGWPTSGIVDVGMRHFFGSRLSGQLGVATLYAPSIRATRLNPTVGMGVRF
jgi:hypothetical protein